MDTEVPAAARELSTLERIDYEDAFRVEIDHARERTAEQWARALLEDAPESTRRTLRCGWLALGLRLGSTESPERVLGWEVRHSSPDFALLGAGSRLGLEGEIYVERREHALLAGTFVRLKNPIARLVWSQITPRHRHVVRHMLGQVRRREAAAHEAA